MIKVHVFHTGSVKVDQAIPLHESNPLAVTGLFRGEKKKRILPVSCYLIEHPKGTILIDTGWDTKFATERPKEMFGLVDKISDPIIKSEEGVDTHLAKLGIRPRDIDAVYFSHMDFDHTSGIRLVKDAKAFYASEEEKLDAKKSKFRYVDTWSGFCEIKEFKYENTGIGPVGKSYDVFHDQTVQLINIPGHSHGLFAVKIEGKNGQYVILANDGAYVLESFTTKTIPGFTVDNGLAQKSLDWLCGCLANENCLEVLANHDPSVTEHVICLE